MDHLERAQLRVTVVGGLPGSGKTTLARGLASVGDSVLLSSDVIRKELRGLDANRPAPRPLWRGMYSRAFTDETYRVMLQRAETHLASGTRVVLDATFTSSRWRAAAREVARSTAADITELCCVTDNDGAKERIAIRVNDASDADAHVRSALAQEFDPWPEATVLDTSTGWLGHPKDPLDQTETRHLAGASATREEHE